MTRVERLSQLLTKARAIRAAIKRPSAETGPAWSLYAWRWQIAHLRVEHLDSQVSDARADAFEEIDSVTF